jgi:hypothetical protein
LEAEQMLLSIRFSNLPFWKVPVMLDNKAFPTRLDAGQHHRMLRSSRHELAASSVYQ